MESVDHRFVREYPADLTFEKHQLMSTQINGMNADAEDVRVSANSSNVPTEINVTMTRLHEVRYLCDVSDSTEDHQMETIMFVPYLSTLINCHSEQDMRSILPGTQTVCSFLIRNGYGRITTADCNCKTWEGCAGQCLHL